MMPIRGFYLNFLIKKKYYKWFKFKITSRVIYHEKNSWNQPNILKLNEQ